MALALERLAWNDADARTAIEDRMEHRRAGPGEVVGAVAAAGRLAPGWSVDDVVDVLWAAGAPSSWQHLVGERGWSPARFERWLVHLARSFVVRPPSAPGGGRGRGPGWGRSPPTGGDPSGRRLLQGPQQAGQVVGQGPDVAGLGAGGLGAA